MSNLYKRIEVVQEYINKLANAEYQLRLAEKELIENISEASIVEIKEEIEIWKNVQLKFMNLLNDLIK